MDDVDDDWKLLMAIDYSNSSQPSARIRTDLGGDDYSQRQVPNPPKLV